MALALQPIIVVAKQGLMAAPLLVHGPAAMGGLGEASGQTYKIGAPLVASSGYLAEASTNPTAVIGIAAVAASGVQGTVVPFYPALQDSLLFEISVDKASAQGGAAALVANTTVFTTYGITKDATTGFWYMDVDKSGGNQVVRVMGARLDPNTSTFDFSVINGRIWVQWLRASSTIYV